MVIRSDAAASHGGGTCRLWVSSVEGPRRRGVLRGNFAEDAAGNALAFGAAILSARLLVAASERPVPVDRGGCVATLCCCNSLSWRPLTGWTLIFSVALKRGTLATAFLSTEESGLSSAEIWLHLRSKFPLNFWTLSNILLRVLPALFLTFPGGEWFLIVSIAARQEAAIRSIWSCVRLGGRVEFHSSSFEKLSSYWSSASLYSWSPLGGVLLFGDRVTIATGFAVVAWGGSFDC